MCTFQITVLTLCVCLDDLSKLKLICCQMILLQKGPIITHIVCRTVFTNTNPVFCFQVSGPQIACKSEENGRSFGEKPTTRPPAFQIHVDEPDGACSKKPSTKRAAMDCSPLTLNPTVTRLRQPLATIDLPLEASFGKINQFKLNAMPVQSCCSLENLMYKMYNSQYIDSPMEMSIIGGEERSTNVNEVSDYATEIHTHLREMEVRLWKLNVWRVNFNLPF